MLFDESSKDLSFDFILGDGTPADGRVMGTERRVELCL